MDYFLINKFNFYFITMEKESKIEKNDINETILNLEQKLAVLSENFINLTGMLKGKLHSVKNIFKKFSYQVQQLNI
jgi:hypothetical protein